MTRKHYEALAYALLQIRDDIGSDALAEVIAAISKTCKADNPRFDSAKFYRAAMGYQ